MEWEKSDRALKKLKQMLWGYESLRAFRDMLKTAIEQVDKARARMAKLLENVGLSSPMTAVFVLGITWNTDSIADNLFPAPGGVNSP